MNIRDASCGSAQFPDVVTAPAITWHLLQVLSFFIAYRLVGVINDSYMEEAQEEEKIKIGEAARDKEERYLIEKDKASVISLKCGI